MKTSLANVCIFHAACIVEKMRFKHISDVSPFLEIDPHWDHDVVDTYGRPVNVKSVDANFAKFERRTFNTHLPFELTPVSTV